jgi:hypothetical protein
LNELVVIDDGYESDRDQYVQAAEKQKIGRQKELKNVHRYYHNDLNNGAQLRPNPSHHPDGHQDFETTDDSRQRSRIGFAEYSSDNFAMPGDQIENLANESVYEPDRGDDE